MTSIAARDYGFYTQGNARYLDTALLPTVTPNASLDPNTGAPSHLNAPARTQSAAASNYRTLRDTDNRYNIAGGPGQIIWYYIDWTPDMVKINQGTPNSLIGTDSADSMDAAYYATYLGSTYAKFFNLDLLTNFYAGGGDDQFGGSARSDNLWGGFGSDVLYGYAGDDHLYGEEGDDVSLGQDGNDVLIDTLGNNTLDGGNGNDYLDAGSGSDYLAGGAGRVAHCMPWA
jgi:Ca2+-binding RTX toxin-like protein